MNATLGGVNLHPGANLHPGTTNCAYEHGFRLGITYYAKYICIIYYAK